MIEFVKGDFFDYEADIRVNTVNCVGVMGAGVALAFKTKYPQMFEEYVRACSLGQVKPGVPHVWDDNNIFGTGRTIIINFPTKVDWKKPSEYEYVEKGLIWLRDYLKERSFKAITVPALGCGHGGLDWTRVKVLIEEYLKGIDGRILVFEPASSNRNEKQEDLSLVLNERKITKISVTDKSYPIRLKHKNPVDFYIQGNKDFLSKKLVSLIVDSKTYEREKGAVSQFIKSLSMYDNIVYLLGFSNSFEIDVVKEILMQNAKAVLVLPYGILELKIRKDLIPFWNEEQLTVISTTNPKQTWKAHESINALKFRIKAADAILMANMEIDPLMKFEKELKYYESKLFYINYWNEKVEFYEKLHARQIGRNSVSKEPNVSTLVTQLSKDLA